MLPEVKSIRELRSKQVSYDAFSFASEKKDRILTLSEIEKKVKILEAEMKYLEGYISLKDLEDIRSKYAHSTSVTKKHGCKCCGVASDYIVWNDVLVYDDDTFTLARIPLVPNNTVEKFKKLREELVQGGSKNFKSLLLGEVNADSLIESLQICFGFDGEELLLGVTCPNCGQKISGTIEQQSCSAKLGV